MRSKVVNALINSATFISLAHSMFYFCTHENYTSNCNTCTIRTLHDIFTTIIQVDESTRRSSKSHFA